MWRLATKTGAVSAAGTRRQIAQGTASSATQLLPHGSVFTLGMSERD